MALKPDDAILVERIDRKRKTIQARLVGALDGKGNPGPIALTNDEALTLDVLLHDLRRRLTKSDD